MAENELTRAEEWRLVPGYCDYEVSSLGRVRRLSSRTSGKAGQIRKTKSNPKSGHVMVQLWRHGVSTNTAVSRLMALAFLGPMPSPSHEAAHNDGDAGRNVLGNIRWATPKENAADRVPHGTNLAGIRHPMAVLSEAAVLEIRRKYAGGSETLESLGDQYGVTLHAIYRVVKRKTWAHVA